MTATYEDFTELADPLESVIREAKLVVLRENLGSELNRLTAMLLEICEGHRRQRDYTRHDCHEVLRELAVAFPRYRTYVRARDGEISLLDSATIRAAVDEAIAARPELDPELFEFVGDILTLRVTGKLESELAMRFQQLTGAVMAKGVEDTAFYRYHRLVSLNEVGGDPGRFGVSPTAFHQANADRLASWPEAMLTTSTHDTKRSEDVRARLHVLSEVPEAWAAAVARWSARLERHRTGEFPDRNAEYLLYQTIVGTWPIEVDRLTAYLIKATREGQAHTSWSAPNLPYEGALTTFTEAALADSGFIADLEAFIGPVVAAGRLNSLAQTLLKLTVPGVPDIYQGSELWDLSLVDPDNRRPVDFERRARILDLMTGASTEVVTAEMDEGWPKLWTISRTLAARAQRPELFDGRAGYQPIEVTGTQRDRAVGFLRGKDLAVVVPRLTIGLGAPAWGAGNGWADTAVELPPGTWTNVLDDPGADAVPSERQIVRGGSIFLSELFARFPVALLERASARPEGRAAR